MTWNLSQPLSAAGAAAQAQAEIAAGTPVPSPGDGVIPAGMELTGPVIPMSTANGPVPCRHSAVGVMRTSESTAVAGCNWTWFNYPKAPVHPPSGYMAADGHWANDSSAGTPAEPWHTAAAAESAVLFPDARGIASVAPQRGPAVHFNFSGMEPGFCTHSLMRKNPLDPGGTVVLRSGGFLMSPIMFLCNGSKLSGAATSVVAVRSRDGFHWRFTTVIARAWDFASTEGPNGEHDHSQTKLLVGLDFHIDAWSVCRKRPELHAGRPHYLRAQAVCRLSAVVLLLQRLQLRRGVALHASAAHARAGILPPQAGAGAACAESASSGRWRDSAAFRWAAWVRRRPWLSRQSSQQWLQAQHLRLRQLRLAEHRRQGRELAAAFGVWHPQPPRTAASRRPGLAVPRVDQHD